AGPAAAPGALDAGASRRARRSERPRQRGEADTVTRLGPGSRRHCAARADAILACTAARRGQSMTQWLCEVSRARAASRAVEWAWFCGSDASGDMAGDRDGEGRREATWLNGRCR